MARKAAIETLQDKGDPQLEAQLAQQKIDRKWVENIEFHLMKNQGTSFALFLHQVVVVLSDVPGPKGTPAFIYMRDDSTVVMQFHAPSVARLSLYGAVELMKHEILHVIFGHLCSLTKDLYKDYHPDIVGIAMDLAVNQQVDEKLLAREGFKGTTIEDFGFPPNLTTRQYCELLKEKIKIIEVPLLVFVQGKCDKKGPGSTLKVAVPSSKGGKEQDPNSKKGKGGKDSGQGTADQQPDPSQPILPSGVWEVIGETQVPDAVRDMKIEKIILQVRDEAQKRDGTQSRGWDAGEAKEVIEQLKRRPSVPWFTYLRMMESRHLRTERVLTRRRPSRRCPTHFGRIRKNGLYVWFGVDTSGSMGVDQLCRVDPELKGIYQRGAEVMVIHCDAGIAKIEEYNPRRGLREFCGRGGTDFSPIFLHLKETHWQDWPDFMVLYTDGYGGIEAYAAKMREELGNKYDEYCSKHLTKTPEGIDLLCVLPPNCTKPDAFREIVPFGKVVVLPLLPGQKAEEEES